MAKAEVIPVKVEGLTLTLTMEEVRTLYSVFLRVGGSPINSPRKHIAAINEAIEKALGTDDFEWSWADPERALIRRDAGLMIDDYGSTSG